jgi:hypothetical protein
VPPNFRLLLALSIVREDRGAGTENIKVKLTEAQMCSVSFELSSLADDLCGF